MMAWNVGGGKLIRSSSKEASKEALPVALFASGSGSAEARTAARTEPADPAVSRATLQAFYRSRYERFLKEPVAMLVNHTPREASRKKECRRPLLELMKMHINGIEQTNRRDRTEIDLDWLLEDTRFPELPSCG